MPQITDTDGHLYQPLVIWNKEIRVSFHKERLAYPIYAPYVFQEPAQATKFLSDYIKELINTGVLPKDVVDEKGNVDENKIKPAVVDVVCASLELEDEEVISGN